MGTMIIVGMDGIVQHRRYYPQPPPPSPPPLQFIKEQEDRGKWEEISAAIESVACHIINGGGGGYVEGRESYR